MRHFITLSVCLCLSRADDCVFPGDVSLPSSFPSVIFPSQHLPAHPCLYLLLPCLFYLVFPFLFLFSCSSTRTPFLLSPLFSFILSDSSLSSSLLSALFLLYPLATFYLLFPPLFLLGPPLCSLSSPLPYRCFFLCFLRFLHLPSFTFLLLTLLFSSLLSLSSSFFIFYCLFPYLSFLHHSFSSFILHLSFLPPFSHPTSLLPPSPRQPSSAARV